MKHMNKILALALALIMVLGLATTVSAAEGDTYTVTINNTNDKHTYEAYQIFAGDLSERILSNIVWGSGVSEAGKTDLGDAAAKAESIKTEADAKVFAQEVEQYLTNPAKTVEVPDGATSVAIDGLEAGYYLIKDVNKSLDGLNESYTSFLMKVVKTIAVNTKMGTTTSEKKVDDKNDSNTTQDATVWEDSADHDIGDDVPFQLKATVAEDYNNYKVYKLTFHDKESAGLTFNNDAKVYVDGVLIEGGYQVVTEGLADGCTFEVRFADLKQIAAVKAGSVITIEYTSKLNENAVLGSAGNPNTMYVTYSNNPNDEQGGENGKTPDDTVIVFTYKVIVNKVDGEKNPLAGAAFTLYKKNANGEYVALKTIETGDGENENVFSFKGLDDGDYKLVETTTPAGYNTIEDIFFTITAEHEILSDNPTLTSLSGNVTSGEAEFTASVPDGSLTTDVVNQAGATLPETGGMGTTLFYAIGGLLVAAAVVLLVTKKRMASAE